MTPYFQDAAVTIYCGDCREIVPQLGAYDHVLTDPPYDAKTHAGARTAKDGAKESFIDFAPLVDLAGLVALITPSRWAVAFCSLEMLGAYRDAAGDR